MCFFSQGESEGLSPDEDEGLCTLSEGCSLVLQYEYHIVYSCSYSTPVLYFRAFSLGQFHVRAPVHVCWDVGSPLCTRWLTCFTEMVVLLFPVCGRGEEPVVRGHVGICASQLQTPPSQQSSQHHQSPGKRRSYLSNWPTGN